LKRGQGVELVKHDVKNKSRSSDPVGHLAPDLRIHDFMSRRFQHGARQKFLKREIVKNLGIGPMIATHGHMENMAIKNGKSLLSGG
jgi:hypothetical protein